MKLFNRSNNPEAAPSTPKNSYQAEPRQRMWKVWLLSITTFVITVLLVLILFWVIRWGWHQVTDKPKTATPTVQKAPATNTREGAASTSPDSSSSSSSSSSNSGTAVTPAPTPAAPSTSAPATSSSPSTVSPTLVNTGPTSDD